MITRIWHGWTTFENYTQAYEYYERAMKLVIKYSLHESDASKAVKKNMERIKNKIKLMTLSKVS